jgi:hypothetical protein
MRSQALANPEDFGRVGEAVVDGDDVATSDEDEESAGEQTDEEDGDITGDWNDEEPSW